MTDLERVREALLDRKRMTEAWLPGFTEGALSDLDAHLKEDADRENEVEDLIAQRDHSDQRYGQAVDELTELREAVRVYIDFTEHGEYRNNKGSQAYMLNRLRQLIEGPTDG